MRRSICTLKIRERDHSRRHGTDDTVQYGEPTTPSLATLRASRALRWRTWNTRVNTGRPMGAAVPGRAGIHAPVQSRTELTPTPVSTRQRLKRAAHLGTEGGEVRAVSGWSSPDDDVQPALGSKHILPDDFAESTFQPIAIHRRLPMARYDDAYPWKAERGSARPDGEVPGPSTFPSCSMRLMSAPRLMRCAREKRRRDLRGGVLGRKLHGQALPTLFATPAEHFAAPTRRHPGTKSVLPDSALVARAICGLTHELCM